MLFMFIPPHPSSNTELFSSCKRNLGPFDTQKNLRRFLVLIVLSSDLLHHKFHFPHYVRNSVLQHSPLVSTLNFTFSTREQIIQTVPLQLGVSSERFYSLLQDHYHFPCFRILFYVFNFESLISSKNV